MIKAFAIGFAVLTSSQAGAQAPPKWRLVEEWRKGGQPEGAYSFENAADLKAMPGGRVVVLDRGSLRLHIFDSTGTLVRSAGGRGGGPGEMRSPMGIAVSHTGTIIVNDPGNGRFSTYSPDGQFSKGVTALRQPRMYFSIMWDASFDRTGRLLASIGLAPKAPKPNVPGSGSPFADSTLLTERWSADFAKTDTSSLCSAPFPMQTSPVVYVKTGPSGPGQPPGGWVGWNEIPFTVQRPYYARDLDGMEWGPREFKSAELVKRESGKCGTVIARATLRGPRERIPSTRRDSALKFVPAEHQSKTPREFAWFHGLRVDDQNRLWVERELANGSRFDVFSPTGLPLAEVEIPRGMMLEAPQVALIAIGNGRVYGFVKDADDLRYLVSWRIVR